MNTEKSAIRIQKDDLNTSMNHPRVCLQCKDMKCIDDETIDEIKAKHQFVWPKERAGKCPFDRLTAWGQEAYHWGRKPIIVICAAAVPSVSAFAPLRLFGLRNRANHVCRRRKS
jgi:hypothetical protein